ncbi:copper-containing nitrite reductase [Halobellus sp. EA9]|uniref:copper-containing nitrite reductase n=1 Tax=Halobellus sp. EA9 TaxID=3421647 RepID=UPI003EBD4BB1
MFDTTRRRTLEWLGIGGAASIAGCSTQAPTAETVEETQAATAKATSTPKPTDVDRVAADPGDIPDPISRSEPKHHDVTLTVEEVTAEIEEGVTFSFMTFDGQIPGPMIRVRQGDTVSLTMENPPENSMGHNVDLHAVYGTGGGNVATTAAPGKENSMEFKAMYPGAYIYHCAVANLDYHISSGMFGMIVVEPKEGLPEVDREFYLGQHEIYTDKAVGETGHHGFSMENMANEQPTYVVFNGEKYPFTPDKYGTMKAQQGERVRVFLVDGGPNYSSNFHPIGNVWSKGYRDGSLEPPIEKHLQTAKVPPGSCFVGEIETPVPERIKLVDHALSRVARRGLLAEIDVEGDERPEVFDPSPDTPPSEDEEGPLY